MTSLEETLPILDREVPAVVPKLASVAQDAASFEAAPSTRIGVTGSGITTSGPFSSTGVPSNAARPRPSRRSLVTVKHLLTEF